MANFDTVKNLLKLQPVARNDKFFLDSGASKNVFF